MAASGGTARAAMPTEIVIASDVLLLATPWPATLPMLAAAGDVTGKILIGATNPLLPDLSGLEVGTSGSGGEMVAAHAHGAKMVKAFNSVGSSIMADPKLNGESAVLFYCGDDAAAKTTVHQLAEELGFDARAPALSPRRAYWSFSPCFGSASRLQGVTGVGSLSESSGVNFMPPAASYAVSWLH